MPASSLFNLALATAIRFVKDLDDLGAMPYILARPILMNVHNPEKLEDGEIWLDLIKRDIPSWDKYDLPEETDNWYGVYCDLRDQVQRDLDADAERMKMAIDGISAKRALLTPKIIPDGRSSRMAGARPTAKQRQVAFARRLGVTRAPYDPGRSDASSKKKSIFQPTKINSALTMPTKSLNNRASQIKRAPIALVEEHRRPTLPSKPAPPPKAPAQSTTQAPPISRRPGMLPPSLQHPMLAQTGSSPSPRPVSKTKISAPRTASSAGGPSNVSATKKPVTASTKMEPKGGTDSYPLPSPPTAKPSLSPPPAHLLSSRPPTPGSASPRQGVIRRRPPPSIFMPAKRRRV
ncbi:hypothetical protein N7535_005382 [Penicillium sp. DV-2018c]|nr:hypothetical protein N7535_005382 [Penicillium sp. DV-2018c]